MPQSTAAQRPTPSLPPAHSAPPWGDQDLEFEAPGAGYQERPAQRSIFGFNNDDMTNAQHLNDTLLVDEASIYTSMPVDDGMPNERGRTYPWAQSAYGPHRRSRSQGAEPMTRNLDNSWQEWQDYIRLRGVRPI